MERDEVVVLDTGITMAEWRGRSRAGELCGILGCGEKPVVKCMHCGNHYCRGHQWVIDTPGHGKQ